MPRLHTLANFTEASTKNTTAAAHRRTAPQPSTTKPAPAQSNASAASRSGGRRGHCLALGAVIGFLSIHRVTGYETGLRTVSRTRLEHATPSNLRTGVLLRSFPQLMRVCHYTREPTATV